MRIERFAPSPTGYLHLGHGFSALMAARDADRFVLRIEDTDTARCRSDYESAIYQDLEWLGLRWQEPVWRQSERTGVYRTALDRLIRMNLVYPCRCTRKDIAAAQSGADVTAGPDGIPYPGTCRGALCMAPEDGAALRLDVGAALDQLGDLSQLRNLEIGEDAGDHALNADYVINACGDFVLWRKDTQTAAYHLAVVVDDAAQGVTHVTRGMDVAPATPIHRLLQALLGLPTPIYNHHRLITDETGKRLAKSFDSRALRKYRTEGMTPDDLRSMLGL